MTGGQTIAVVSLVLLVGAFGAIAVDEVTVGVEAAVEIDHVDLEEARRQITPVGEGSQRDTASDCSARTLAALALPVDMQTRTSRHAVDRRRTNPAKPWS